MSVKYDGPPDERTCLGCGAPVVWDRGDLAWRVLVATNENNVGLICVAGTDEDGADDLGHYVTAEKVLEVDAAVEIYYEDALKGAVAEVSTEAVEPFVRIHEWNDVNPHVLVPTLSGKRVRVTVEVLS